MRLLVWPYRAVLALRLIADYTKVVLVWLARSREHTNFTYDVTPRNLRQLAWFVATLTDTPVERVEELQIELLSDLALRGRVAERAENMTRKGLSDAEAHYGRRVVWYTLTRILRPKVVVETGVDKGLGTIVIGNALFRNVREGYPGRCIAIDINAEAGQLLTSDLAGVVDLRFGDALALLKDLEGIDIFIHDSNHDYTHEQAELALAFARLSPSGLLLSDAASASDALDDFARTNNLSYSYIAEEPARHWMRPQGVGVAARSKKQA